MKLPQVLNITQSVSKTFFWKQRCSRLTCAIRKIHLHLADWFGHPRNNFYTSISTFCDPEIPSCSSISTAQQQSYPDLGLYLIVLSNLIIESNMDFGLSSLTSSPELTASSKIQSEPTKSTLKRFKRLFVSKWETTYNRQQTQEVCIVFF